ncbi:MAG: ATP-binding protein [Gemmatimonadota bacterium]
MIRSLRLRVFLTMWPLTVVAVIAVAWSFARWIEVELQASVQNTEPVVFEVPQRMVDGLTQLFAEDAEPDANQLDQTAIAAGHEGDLAFVDRSGRLVSSTLASIELFEAPVRPGALATFDVVRTDGAREQAERIALPGLSVSSGSGDVVGTVYLFSPMARFAPPIDFELDETSATVRTDARRTLLLAVLAASLAAAVGTLLLGRPIVGQVGRLSAAAAAVERGELDVRVEAGSRDELGRLEESFNSMAEALARADASKQRMVGDIAHELRTPLTNVVGLLESVQDGLRPADSETIALIHREATALTDLVEDLQELTLAESGELEYDLRALDPAAEARAALEAHAHELERRRSTVSVSTSRSIRADRRRLRQVLGNLIRNAVQHTRDGDSIHLLAEDRGDWVRLTVEDSGQGIPEGEVAHVWDRFYRVDGSRNRASGGMGLGLAIVRQLVRGMGGTVSVSSEVGVGTRFAVDLPIVS